MVLQALKEEGGVLWLRGLARDEPESFATLLGRILPLQITGNDGQPLVFNVYTGLPPSKTEVEDAEAAAATTVPVLGIVNTDA